MTRSILMAHPGALGDVLLAVPTVQRLKKKYSHHKIVLLAQPQVSRFLASCRLVDQWLPIEQADIAEIFMGHVRNGSRIADWLQDCDEAVFWMEDKGQDIERTLRHYGVQKFTIRSPFHPGLTRTHQIDRFLETIGEQPLTLSDYVPVTVPDEIVEMGRARLSRYGPVVGRPFVVLHPGSGSHVKCVKPEVLAMVVAHLDSQGLGVLILEGPADEESVGNLRRVARTPVTVVRGLDVSTVAGILSQAHLYIGHDSGVTHLAALVGVQTLALFGPTNPERWGPRGHHVRILQGVPCACVSWKDAHLCQEKPCLSIKLSEMHDAIENISKTTNSSFWNTACHALSPPNLCDKVPR